MATTPSGTGSEWPSGAPDIDQPLGLSYRAIQHIFTGVSNRIKQQHTAFADATAGGLHKPGGTSVLMVDTTENLTLKVGDLTTAAYGLGYCASGHLYYMNSANNSWCTIGLSPQSFCKGVDMTWGGDHKFTGSVVISGSVCVAGGAYFDATVDISGTTVIDGTLDVLGKAEFTSAVFDGSVDISQSLYCYSNAGIAGDISRAGVVVGMLPSAFASFNGDSGALLRSYNVANADKSATGLYCISFTNALSNANYLVTFGVCVSDDLHTFVYGCFSTPLDTGFRMFVRHTEVGLQDITRISFLVYGG